MVNEFEIKKQLCDIGKRIYNRNMVAANDGNFSVKVAENEYLCTQRYEKHFPIKLITHYLCYLQPKTFYL